jgi:hypothetical protein
VKIKLTYGKLVRVKKEKNIGGEFPAHTFRRVFCHLIQKEPEAAEELERLGFHVLPPSIHRSGIVIFNPQNVLPSIIDPTT